MSIPVDFQKNVLEKQLSVVRVILKDSLVIDPTFVEFEEMYKYAKDNMNNLLEEFDNEELDYNRENWTEYYLNNLKIKLMDNYSEKRLGHLKEICSYLYQDKTKVNKLSEANKQKSGIKVTYKQSTKPNPIGQGAIVLGLVSLGIGVILSKTALILVGLLVATVGGVLLSANR